jgi:shikimate 5-dehydrogenase
MSSISVLLIGAGGALGRPILEELVRQKSSFTRIAILTTPDRAHKLQNLGAEVVSSKSLYEPLAYKGEQRAAQPVCLALVFTNVVPLQVSHTSSPQWETHP